jgi:hypothetical protein
LIIAASETRSWGYDPRARRNIIALITLESAAKIAALGTSVVTVCAAAAAAAVRLLRNIDSLRAGIASELAPVGIPAAFAARLLTRLGTLVSRGLTLFA